MNKNLDKLMKEAQKMSMQQFITALIQDYFAPADYGFTVGDGYIDSFERRITDTTKALFDFITTSANNLVDERFDTFQFDGFKVIWYYPL